MTTMMTMTTKTPTSDSRESVMLPVQYREAPIVAGSVDAEQRTFDVVWTAGAEVPRVDWWTGNRFIEVLEVSETAIRLDRLKSGRAPVLDSHARWSLDNILGVIDGNSVKVERGQGRATVRLSKRGDIAGLVSDIRDGIIGNVSPGYVTHSYREEMRDGVLYRIATDWEPMEISFVPVGADPEAGRRNAAAGPVYPCRIIREAPPPVSLAPVRMRMRQLASAVTARTSRML
jgi:hypothetical protein